MSRSGGLLDRIPWPVRSVAAGTVGTAAMGCAYALERRALHSPVGTPLDFDDSDVPGQIVASILHLGQVSDRRDHEIGMALRWSYGSAFGLWHGLLRTRIGEPWASLAFGGTLLTATLSLFPVLGRTPPPWRWSRGYLLTCLLTHAVYVVGVGATDDRLRDDDRS